MMDIYTTPLLTARDAALHLAMPESTLDTWLAQKANGEPMVHSVVPTKRGWPRVPFVGIIEAHVLRNLRQLGLLMAEIRTAVELVREDVGDPYALASRGVETDGMRVFARLADDSYVAVLTGQRPFESVVRELFKDIHWDHSGKPSRLRLDRYAGGPEVVIDPRFAWGSPVLEATKTPVRAVTELWRAGEPMESVAQEFGLTRDDVERICRAAA